MWSDMDLPPQSYKSEVRGQMTVLQKKLSLAAPESSTKLQMELKAFPEVSFLYLMLIGLSKS